MPSYDLQINGQTHTVEAEAQMPLLWVLRDLLGLTGTKFSCGAGLCGSCTVLIDGEPTRSCVTLVESVAGKTIMTIEDFHQIFLTHFKKHGLKSVSHNAAIVSPDRS